MSIKIGMQFFGRKGPSSMSGGGTAAASSRSGAAASESNPARQGGGISSLNGISLEDATADYWSKGVRDKTYTAQTIFDERPKGYEHPTARVVRNTVNMVAADIAKRMGYNISGSGGPYSDISKELNSVMGKQNADALREHAKSSARTFLDSRKKRK